MSNDSLIASIEALKTGITSEYQYGWDHALSEAANIIRQHTAAPGSAVERVAIAISEQRAPGSGVFPDGIFHQNIDWRQSHIRDAKAAIAAMGWEIHSEQEKRGLQTPPPANTSEISDVASMIEANPDMCGYEVGQRLEEKRRETLDDEGETADELYRRLSKRAKLLGMELRPNKPVSVSLEREALRKIRDKAQADKNADHQEILDEIEQIASYAILRHHVD